jgi:glycosyltransferase involved in cell wall biosynthesis
MRLALGRNHSISRVFQVPGPLHLEHHFLRFAEVATAGNSDSWIGSCRCTCEYYRKSGIEDDRIYLSYYGTDLDTFKRKPSGTLRKELSVSDQTKIIGMVAYMYPPRRYLGQRRGIKGHEDFIDAVAICLQHIPDIVSVIIGGAWNNAFSYERKVREHAAKKCGNRVIFLGTRQDVLDLYPDFDVAVHPSLSENVGGVVESLLHTVPTIATSVGGFPDLVRHGETGWLVPPANPQKLADTIIEVLQDPVHAKEMSNYGKDLAIQLFDVRRNAEEIIEIYKNILGKRHVC